MAKKSIEKTRENRITPAETENTGKFQALRAWFPTKISTMNCQKREDDESIEMPQRNRPTPANDDQPERGQALRNWLSSSFGRKALGVIFSWFCFLSTFLLNLNYPFTKC